MELYKSKLTESINSLSEFIQTLQITKNDIIIFDIDETLLLNASYYNDNKIIVDNELRAEDDKSYIDDIGPCIPEMIDKVYNFVKNKCKIILITGRSIKLKELTLYNLQKYNISFDDIYFYDNSSTICVCHFKNNIRKQLNNVLLNIGDQDSDLLYGNSKYSFKLPSFYTSNCTHVTYTKN